jgi:hypothetical protein
MALHFIPFQHFRANRTTLSTCVSSCPLLTCGMVNYGMVGAIDGLQSPTEELNHIIPQHFVNAIAILLTKL